MRKIGKLAMLLHIGAITALPIGAVEAASTEPSIVQQIIERAKENKSWKVAVVTGPEEQIVFMNISPETNPKNEIGMEVHPFDQAILIVEGKGKSVLNGSTSIVEEGDLIFVPRGTRHNVINLNDDDPLKVISFYSDTDMPQGATYRSQAEQQD